MLTLGIDPGTARFGFGLIDGDRQVRHVTHGCLTTPAGQPLGTRLASIRDGLNRLFQRHAITDVAIERLGYARRLTSAVEVSHAIAVAHLVAADHGVPVEEYAPPEIKLAVTGYGGADKNSVQEMVRRFLELERPPRPDHASDALAVAICHVNSYESRALERKVGVR
jgi:crossover junction endodeoxyribonuclease RuvC